MIQDPLLEKRSTVTFPQLDALQKKIGYKFNDRKRLIQALTHASFLNKEQRLASNERLEFLGDKIISCFVALFLFREFPGSSEGGLTKITAELTTDRVLAEIADSFCLGEYVLIGEVERVDINKGSRSRARVLACSLEALVAAIYLDGDAGAIENFTRGFLPVKIKETLARGPAINPKSELQVFVARRFGINCTYRFKERWVRGCKLAIAEVYAGNQLLGQGSDTNKSKASREAAKNALGSLKNSERF